MDTFHLPDSVDKAITNLTDPLTYNAGKTLGDIWYIVFGGISDVAEKRRLKVAKDLENYKQELDHAISSIPKEKYVEPSLNVTAQALENSKYCVEEPELRKMFVSLISKSMNNDFASDAHPSFSELIKQMSVLDAKTISLLKKQNKEGIPICCIRRELDIGYHELARDLLLHPVCEDTFIQASSISSLERFGLIRTDYTRTFNNESLYNGFDELPLYQAYQLRYGSDKVFLKKGVIVFTVLGFTFCNVCVPD